MKQIKIIAIALFTVLAAGVSQAQEKKINVSKSKIMWVGKKVTGQHSGTVMLKDGTLMIKDGKVTGGKFVVDMTSITDTDLKAGDGKEKLEGHLKSEDFFGTEKNPTAMLSFKNVSMKSAGTYNVTADLTIKGITNPVTFDMTVKGNTATAKLTIDRTKYGIKYGSGSFFDNLGDKAISDSFDVTAEIVF